MFEILLKYIAKTKPGAKVAFFYSDTEFGKDPIPASRNVCKKLKLDLVAEEVAKVGDVDVTSQVLDLKRKNPDYVIFQGFVLSPVSAVIKQCRDFGMKTQFMGTFWGTTKMLLDEPSMGLSPMLMAEIFRIIQCINMDERVTILLVQQNARMALSIAQHGYVMENGRIVLDDEVEKLRENADIKEFYLGLTEMGTKKSYRDVKHYKRRKRWLT